MSNTLIFHLLWNHRVVLLWRELKKFVLVIAALDDIWTHLHLLQFHQHKCCEDYLSRLACLHQYTERLAWFRTFHESERWTYRNIRQNDCWNNENNRMHFNRSSSVDWIDILYQLMIQFKFILKYCHWLWQKWYALDMKISRKQWETCDQFEN